MPHNQYSKYIKQTLALPLAEMPEISGAERLAKSIMGDDRMGTVPLDFICSITREIMVDPVCTIDGETYERAGPQCRISTEKNSTVQLFFVNRLSSVQAQRSRNGSHGVARCHR
jgi:hypothetical protein